MQDVMDIIKNVERVYESNTSFQVLKDFERVLDQLDVYVYDNWVDGELASGPHIGRHWVTCRFFWPLEKMPDPMGGKRLLDYDCKVGYVKTSMLKPRKIRTPDDIRPGTKKGKLDKEPIWIVEIKMPKKLIADIWTGYEEKFDFDGEAQAENAEQPADTTAADAGGAAPAAPAAAPAGGDAAGGGAEAVI
jgi:hypothetical protein